MINRQLNESMLIDDWMFAAVCHSLLVCDWWTGCDDVT